MIHIDELFGFFPKEVKETIDNPVLGKIPKYGHHMTKEDFLDDVESGCFIDYDGHGHLATASQESNWVVKPSFANNPWPEWATHVVWYNK